jgi:hypothetical protein
MKPTPLISDVAFFGLVIVVICIVWGYSNV